MPTIYVDPVAIEVVPGWTLITLGSRDLSCKVGFSGKETPIRSFLTAASIWERSELDG